jgi:hypothetical protein
MIEKQNKVKDAKKLFRKLGTCSCTMFYILNRDFGYQMQDEVKALEPLAGGILQAGYQCGMLWGASIGAGAEAFRRYGKGDMSVYLSVKASQDIMKSFVAETNSPDCLDITHCDWQNKMSIAKYMLTGKFLSCFKLIDQWAPSAIDTVQNALKTEKREFSEPLMNCASEVAFRLGANDFEASMVAGFAGGMGLSGNACGALGAAIWFRSLLWLRNNTKKFSISNPYAKSTLEKFQKETDYEFLCSNICGRKFESVEAHSEYIRNGGCEKLLSVLSEK